MKYGMRIWAAGHGPGIELAKAEYEEIVAAVRRIFVANDVEERLDILLENYREYESELLELGLRECLFSEPDDVRSLSEIHVVNRRTINLLTAARTYTDQLKHAVSQYFVSGQSRKKEIKALFSAEYDRHLEYRIAEELRNHSQHRGLPVHKMTRSFEWEENNSPEARLRFYIVPSFSVDQLIDESGFKPSLLAELQAAGKESWSLTPILRRYVESLSCVHDLVRDLLAKQADDDHQALLAALNRAKAELSPNLTGLVVTESDAQGQVKERHYISERAWQRRVFLIQKNRRLGKLSLRYVSGEHPGDAA